MKTQSSSKKTVISAGVIVILLAAIYLFSKNTPVSSDKLLQPQATPEANAASSRILNLRRQIESLKIDTALFKDPAYMSLQDYTVEIPEISVGRPNPFAPIPGFSEVSAPAK